MHPKKFFTHAFNHLWLVCSLSLSYVLILSLVGVPVFAQTGPQPGLDDPLGKPAGRYTLFPDHELAAFISAGAKVNFTVGESFNLFDFSFDTDLNFTQFGQFNELNPFNSQLQVVAAAGRILSPDKDQVVYAWRDDYNALVIVEIQPYGGASLTGIGLPRLVDRPFTAGFTDPLDIAVADLDKRPDASGNNHDEVVVAYASPTANANRWAVNVAVLDYTSDAANNY